MTYFKDTSFRSVYRKFLLFEREAFRDELKDNSMYFEHAHVLVYGFADTQRGLMVSVCGFCDISDQGRMDVQRISGSERIHKRMADLESFEFHLLDADTMGLKKDFSDIVSFYDSLVPEKMAALRDLKALDESRDRYFIDDIQVYIEGYWTAARLEGIRGHVLAARALENKAGVSAGDALSVTLKLFNDHFYCEARRGAIENEGEKAIARYRQTKDKRDARAAMDVLVKQDVFIPLNIHNLDDEEIKKLEKELEEGSERFSASNLIRPFHNAAKGGRGFFPVFTSKQRLKNAMPAALAAKRPLGEVIRALMENETGTEGIAVNPEERPVFLIPKAVFPYLNLKTKKTGEIIPDPEKMN